MSAVLWIYFGGKWAASYSTFQTDEYIYEAILQANKNDTQL